MIEACVESEEGGTRVPRRPKVEPAWLALVFIIGGTGGVNGGGGGKIARLGGGKMEMLRRMQ